MKLLIICTLFIIYACAPTTQQTPIKKEKPTIEIVPQAPVEIKNLDNVIVVLDENKTSQKLFFEEFTNSNLITELDKKIIFYYDIEEITDEKINNTIIIGPNKSDKLILLKEKLGNNNLILSLTNDLTLKRQFNEDQIIFLGMSPFFHVAKLKQELFASTSVAVLYKQSFYGVRINNYLKKLYIGKYIKSSPYTEEPQDIIFSIKALGDLAQYDNVILIDDTMVYKNVLTNLASQDTIYPYNKIYLIDNFLEQRNSISSFYNQINRANISNIDLKSAKDPHREFFYRASVNMAISIAHEIIKTKEFSKIVYSDQLGFLEVKDLTINYPIKFD